MYMDSSLTEWTASKEQEIHSEDTQPSPLSACDGPDKTKYGDKDPVRKKNMFEKYCVCVCVYRGNAVGQVVLAGDAQQLILR